MNRPHRLIEPVPGDLDDDTIPLRSSDDLVGEAKNVLPHLADRGAESVDPFRDDQGMIAHQPLIEKPSRRLN